MTQNKIPKDSNPKELGLSRRKFLVDAGLVAGGVALGASTLSLAGCGGETTTATATKTITEYIKYEPATQMVQSNPQFCASCSTCMAICSARAWGESNPALSAIKVIQDRINGEIVINTCQQCLAPSCMQACPIEAIYINQRTGARIIDQSKCDGCRLCQYACPLDVIVYNPKTNTCFKCDLCEGHPMCIANCPSGGAALKLVNPIEGGV